MTPDRTVRIEPLTREAFAPFGQVLSVEGARHFTINAGMTERYHDLADVRCEGPAARPMISIFVGQPHALPLMLGMVERHPLGSQAFFPLDPRPFLAIVAPDASDASGAPGAPRAFLVPPGTGINIGMGVWHGVLTVLEAQSRFLVVDRGGEGVNLQEHTFEAPWIISDS